MISAEEARVLSDSKADAAEIRIRTMEAVDQAVRAAATSINRSSNIDFVFSRTAWGLVKEDLIELGYCLQRSGIFDRGDSLFINISW
jgi:hypothetical protein